MSSGIPKIVLRKLYEAWGESLGNTAPEPHEGDFRDGIRLLDKDGNTFEVLDELKEKHPDLDFNEDAVKKYISDQYDDAIRKQDLKYGAVENPDGSLQNEGLPIRLDIGFVERMYDDLRRGIVNGEFPPSDPPTDPPSAPPSDPPSDPPSNPPSDPPSDPPAPPPDPPTPWPPAPPAPPRDPLVLDLDGDGVELISLAASTAHFDYAKDGFAEKTGWLSSDDAFVVHDDNGNGIVDGIAELFGSPIKDGFTALGAFDSNGDGKVAANDTGFSTLKLWRDLNSDGVFDHGEMYSLAEYNIASIGVGATPTNQVNIDNRVAFEGIFTQTDGSMGKAEAILFGTNPTISRWDMPQEFEVSVQAKILPNLKGYGLLPDLDYSMTLNDDLRLQPGCRERRLRRRHHLD